MSKKSAELLAKVETDHPQRKLRTAVATSLSVAILLAGAGLLLHSILDGSRNGVSLAVGNAAAHSRASDTYSDAELHDLAVGVWRDFYQGRRTLTLRADGTATMVVELSGFKARMFTPRLELDITWSIEKGKMHRRTVGGRPADKIAFVNRRAGVAVAEPVIALDPDRMILLDKNGSQRYTWRRVKVKGNG